MAETVINIALVAGIVAGIVWLWERWEQRRGLDEEHSARENEYGWRLVKLISLAVVLLAVGLTLAALDVPGASIAALVTCGALLVLIYVAPFLGPRKRRR